MHEPTTPTPDTSERDTSERHARKCPSCGTHLDHTGHGSDELLECPRCGLVMFEQRSRPQSG